LLKQQETEKEMNGSYKLKVKWIENEVYDKDNLRSLFSKVIFHDFIFGILLLDYFCKILVRRCDYCSSFGE
jgi:hypothetical protein